MQFKYFSRDGEVLPLAQAVVPLADLEYSYGFGVYETVRVTRGQAQFLDQHVERLLGSATIIGLEHEFSASRVTQAIVDLVEANAIEACNLKALLIGGNEPHLYVQCLNPLFVDRKLYRDGVSCTTYEYERSFPHAKTLNMLPSYVAYKQAQAAGAHDALLINRDGCITEGTRSNFFALQGRTIISAPETEILLGVTRANLLKTAREHNFEIIEQQLPLASITDYDSVFLTSTSVKILPIRAIGDKKWASVPESLQELMQLFSSDGVA